MSYYLIGDSGTVAFQPYVGVIDSEDVAYSNKVTSNPIEGGGTIDDHAVAEPIKISISGSVTTPVGTEHTTLEAMAQNRDLLSYKGAESYDNMLITSLTFGRSSSIQGGFTFKITLQRMNITGSAYAPIAEYSMSSSDRSATTDKTGAKTETNTGLTTTTSSYADYVNSFNDPQPNNTDIPADNPSYGGY